MENQCGCTLDPTKYHCACFNRETLTCSNANRIIRKCMAKPDFPCKYNVFSLAFGPCTTRTPRSDHS